LKVLPETIAVLQRRHSYWGGHSGTWAVI